MKKQKSENISDLPILLSIVLQFELICGFLERNDSGFASEQIGVKISKLLQFSFQNLPVHSQVDWLARSNRIGRRFKPSCQFFDRSMELGILK
jgi:hypothetical protein